MFFCLSFRFCFTCLATDKHERLFKIVFQDIHFIKVYNNAPSVFVSANHTSTGGNQDPMHNSITAWVEVTQQDQIGECYRNKFTKDITQGKTIQELTCNIAFLAKTRTLFYHDKKISIAGGVVHTNNYKKNKKY